MSKIRIFGANLKQISRLLSVTNEQPDTPEPDSHSIGPDSKSVNGSKHIGSSSQSQGTLFGADYTEHPGSMIGHYKLLRILGEGGMGVVYLAEQEQPIKRQVALKIVKPGMDSRRVVERFEAERQALALLDHPGIAHVYDAGTTDSGRPYFVMEYIDGIPITDHCDQNKLSIENRLDLFRQVCEAIHYAHQRGIIHRDIKASNILVTVHEGKTNPKIIDFGVARAIKKPLTEKPLYTEQGQLLGTPEYMSPEQVNLGSENIDVRSDVYSLGVLLYVLLTGVLPFDPEQLRKGGLETIREIILEEDPKTPSTRVGSLADRATEIAENRRTQAQSLAKCLHGELEWIPLKAMRKDRDQRYQSAAELAEDIHNYLNGIPLLAGPPSKSYRLKKFIKRNQTLIGAFAIVVLTIAIGLVVSMSMYVRAKVQAGQSQTLRILLNDNVLQSLNPNRSQGGEITALSVLDDLSDALEGRFQKDPLVEAEVRHKVGSMYQRHRDTRPAEVHLRRALEIFRQEIDEDDPRMATCMLELGEALRIQGCFDEAEIFFLKAVEQRTRRFGEKANTTLYAKLRLANNWLAMGEYDSARKIGQEVLKATRNEGGDEHSYAILAMQLMGWIDLYQGNYRDAENWFSKVLPLARMLRGPEFSWTAGFRADLGFTHLLLGNFSKAEPLLQEGWNESRRIFGDHNRQVHGIQGCLVRLYVAMNRIKDARNLYAQLRNARIQWAMERGYEDWTSENSVSLTGSMHYEEETDTYTIVGCGNDIWHTFDEFHFAHKALHGDCTITARVESLECVDWMTKAGIMVRKTLEPTSEHASVYIRPGGVIEFRHRRSKCSDALSNTTCIRNLELPHWIRLERQGNTFTAYHSSDGNIWEAVGNQKSNQSKPVKIEMEDTVHVGLIVTSEDPGRTAEARISNVGVIGEVNPAGPFTASEDISLLTSMFPTDDSNQTSSTYTSVPRKRFLGDDLTSEEIEALSLGHGISISRMTYDDANDTYTILGSGTDIWFASDQFHYAHNKLIGPSSIIARIENVERTHNWAKAGVMIRDTTASDSAHAAAFITPENRIAFQYRLEAGQNTFSIRTDPNYITLPHWIKLIREGNMFKAQHSKDGKKWKDLEGGSAQTNIRDTRLAIAEIEMNDPVCIGMAVCSHAGPAVTTEARISNVTVTGDVEPAGEFLWSEDIGFKLIALPDK